MLFNSYIFIFAFLPITFIGYLLVGKSCGGKASIAFLCLASLFFYGWWNPAFLPLILFSLLFNYGVGFLLADRSDGTFAKRALLFFGVGVNLALLGYFKYANFFVENYKLVSGSSFAWETVVLPIAISFFTFQQIAYLVDTSSGVTKEHSFISYTLFVTFFPQLIAGPIVHHSEMMPQFEARKKFTFLKSDVAIGLTIFILGLFKKVAIADTMGSFATPIFHAADSGNPVAFIDAWGAALSYTFQLYFDFSGYSDMAIGLGRLFGIKLPVNFESPYKATSIIEFWRRWHITLSRFLRDYLYIPLGGNRKGSIRRYGNLLITMLLGGLWHGAGWNFLLWGGLHGVYLVVNQLWRSAVQRFRPDLRDRPGYVLTALITTFFAVVVAWVPFRATTFTGTQEILSSMVSIDELRQTEWDLVFQTDPLSDEVGSVGHHWGLFKKFGYSSDKKLYVDIFSAEHFVPQFAVLELFNLDIGGFYWIIFCFVICWFFPNTMEIMRHYKPAYEVYPARIKFSLIRLAWRPNALWAMTSSVCAMVCILLLGSELSEFLYFQF